MVSPHHDDAILSAGQFMADRPDTFVVTVFSGDPLTPENVKTPYDIKCGFKNAREAMNARVNENAAACAMLNADWMNLDFVDSQYNRTDTREELLQKVVDNLEALIDETWFEAIYAPIGLDHPDHQLVAEAVMKLSFKRSIILWEDLPFRVVDPLAANKRVLELRLTQYEQPATTHEKMAKKIRALSCYTSQMGTGILDPYLMYVPERFWKFK